MKAVAYFQSLPITAPEALVDINLPIPKAQGHDVLVEVKAVSVNPVDTKVRKSTQPEAGTAKVLGWDAAGVVTAIGEQVTLFKVGDKVWYAGTITRAGSNSEYQLVDERIVGRMPTNLSFAEAAALPLTSITAWELLFDRLAVKADDDKACVLVIGASGGVGSILVQLAKRLTKLTIIATASRPESAAWLTQIGAHHVINHQENMIEQLKNLGFNHVDYIASLNQTHTYFAQMVELIKPQGKIALIDDPEALDIRLLKRKSASLHWEFMFTRPAFNTSDLIKQHQLLNEVAALVEQGAINSTLKLQLGQINAKNMTQAHALLENGKVIGKIVLEGF